MTSLADKRCAGMVTATAFAVIGVAILAGLGLWQLERKVGKEYLIETMNARLTQAPQDLQAVADWSWFTQFDGEYWRVVFSAEFRSGEEAFVYTAGSAFRPDVQGAGYWVFAPARLADGRMIVVNRGFVPLDRRDPATRANDVHGTVQIVGVMRWLEKRGMFTPAADPQDNVWYLRDLHAMAAAKKWDTTVPFYIDQEGPVPPGGWPKPGKLQINLPNNHLQYAITWFGLALALAGVYAFWLAGQFRDRRATSL